MKCPQWSVSPQLASSQNDISLWCKFVDIVSTVVDLQCVLRYKLDVVSCCSPYTHMYMSSAMTSNSYKKAWHATGDIFCICKNEILRKPMRRATNVQWNTTLLEQPAKKSFHYSDVIMSMMASQITSLTIVYSTVYSAKKISKLRVTGLCEGNSPVTGEFPAQSASNAENVSIWWRHHADTGHVLSWCKYVDHMWPGIKYPSFEPPTITKLCQVVTPNPHDLQDFFPCVCLATW